MDLSVGLALRSSLRLTELFRLDTVIMKMSQEPKQRIFIYDRREVAVLVLLGLMVAVFAFTLGVHLGKKIGPDQVAVNHQSDHTLPAETVDDAVPSRLEMSEQTKDVDDAMDESLNQVLHDEVARSGVKIGKIKQIKLPSKAASKNQGATTGPRAENSAVTQVKKAIVINRPVPHGKYTIQIGSFPSAKEAISRLEHLESSGKRAFIRQAKLKGRGDWFRVYLGGFPSKKDADKIAKKYINDNLINSYIVANMPQE